MNYEKLILECDAHIRAGKDQKAVRAISELDLAKIPRVWRLPLATLCRRIAQIPTGLKILSFVVSSKNTTRPTSAELAEYAALLQKIGAVEDSLRLLARVDEREVPEAILFRAVCHFSKWDYPAAVPLLQRYVGVAATPYQALVGKVNLASALVAVDELAQAERLLNENIEVARESGYGRLEGNCHELLTQVHLLNGDFAKSRERLERAESLISGTGSLDRLFTNKWRAFLTALETRSVEPLVSFRKDAAAFPHAETVRETDLFILMIKPSAELHEHLFFGTPYAFYRERMKRLLKAQPSREEFVFGVAGSPCFDIVSGENSQGASLKPGGSIHKVLQALLYDFYRPARLGSLFGQLFPGEHFDIHSSPTRVHQCLRRTRRWMSENEIPAEIVETKGGYSLRLTGAFSFRLPAHRAPSGHTETLFAKLCEAFPGGDAFTAAAAREKLALTNSAFHRFLKPLLESGHIEKYGASAATVYFIPVQRERKSAS